MALPRVGIIGAGAVGAAVAFAAAAQGVAGAIALYDSDPGRAEGEALDLFHGTPFLGAIDVGGSGDIGVLAGSDVLVFAAGAKQHPGQSRLELAATNVELCRSVLPAALAVAPDAAVLVVTNPVDVVTYFAQDVHPRGVVFGSGTVLDTARLRVLLAARFGVAPPNVHATVIGEHGDSEFVPWSNATIGGAPIERWLKMSGATPDALDEVLGEVRGAAQRIIASKGATSTAIGLSTARIVAAMSNDERAVLPVSTRHDVDGVGEVCLSLPVVVGRHGPTLRAPFELNSGERASLVASATAIRRVIDSIANG